MTLMQLIYGKYASITNTFCDVSKSILYAENLITNGLIKSILNTWAGPLSNVNLNSNNTKDNLQVLSSMYLGVSGIKSNKFNRRVVKKRVWKWYINQV